MAEQKCVYGHIGVTLSPKIAASLEQMSFYGSQDPVLPVLSVTGPWVQRLFGTYSFLHPQWQNRNAHEAMFGVTLSRQTAASLGRMVILR